MNASLTKPSAKISVLLSVYNNADTVEAAIKSILAQTYADFELIIVDDASTDASLQVIKSLAQSDARIRVIENKTNDGLAVSLNRALAEAQGEYIARQDAHATSQPNRFAAQVHYLQEHPDVDVVGIRGSVPLFTKRGTDPLIPDAEIKKCLTRKNVMVHGSVMMRAKTLREAGGYNPNYRYVQDYELWLRLAKRGAVFANLAEPLYEFTQKLKSPSETAQRLVYLMNAKEGNEAILPLSHLPLRRKLEFSRYMLRYFIKRFLGI